MKNDILLLNMGFGAVAPVLCGEQFCEPSHSFGPARREYYLLHFVVEGCGVYHCGEADYPVGPGQLFVIRPEEMTVYCADAQNPWHYIWVGFRVNEPLAEEMHTLLQQNVFTLPNARRIFQEIAASGQLHASRELFVCGKVYELLSMMMESSGQQHNDLNNYVLRAKDYVEANYVSDLSVQGIANYLGLSRSYFSAIFKQSEGVSPQEFIVDLRLRKAGELIAERGYRPGEAAAACGYTDVFNFSKMFKRKFGVPPGHYRREH
ncbi:MAG: AraC family transcriptional regulator [Firmicutes bacterium]|nr:AraC family transcriptional regulator [Bacillota bacterium]